MRFKFSVAKMRLGKGNISISKLFMQYYKLTESCTPVDAAKLLLVYSLF
jgi:hypothetical protein